MPGTTSIRRNAISVPASIWRNPGSASRPRQRTSALALIKSLQGHPKEALSLSRQSIQILKEEGNDRARALAELVLARIQMASGDPSGPVALLERIVKHAQGAKDLPLELEAALRLTLLHSRLGALPDAQKWWQFADRLAVRVDNKRLQLLVTFAKATYLVANRRYGMAQNHSNRTLNRPIPALARSHPALT